MIQTTHRPPPPTAALSGTLAKHAANGDLKAIAYYRAAALLVHFGNLANAVRDAAERGDLAGVLQAVDKAEEQYAVTSGQHHAAVTEADRVNREAACRGGSAVAL